MTWLGKFLKKLFSIREQQEADVVKPFLEHLEDLRLTIFKMAFALAIGAVIAYWYHQEMTAVVLRPLHQAGLSTLSLSITEPFMVSLKLSFYAGLVLAFPALLYFAAEFVLPAMTRREKRFVLPGILAGFVLFGAGVLISYDFVLPRTILFFKDYSAKMGIPMQVRIGDYFSFVTHLTLACGMLCELPVAVIGLSLLGVLSHAIMVATRAYAVVAIGVLVAILAPSPDPFMFLMLFLPVIGIYELCIWIVWFIERQRRKLIEG